MSTTTTRVGLVTAGARSLGVWPWIGLVIAAMGGCEADEAGLRGVLDGGANPAVDGNSAQPGPADSTVAVDTARSDSDGGSDSETHPQRDGGPVMADAGRDATPDAAPLGPPPVVTCQTDDECADDLDCTVDRCTSSDDGGAICTWTLRPEACLIHHVCRSVGEVKPTDPCLECAVVDPHNWSPMAEGAACDDHDLCTESTVCRAGTCGGEPIVCDDEEMCTEEICHPAVGCIPIALEDGLPCNDDSVCTDHDICLGGACTGEPLVCDDGDPCTDDDCDPLQGCVRIDNAAPCEDGDPCTVDDTCDQGRCISGVPDTCNDRNMCTVDVCEPVAGCYHVPLRSPCCIGVSSICEDGNPCTDDLCDPDTSACSYQFNVEPCDDQNACTQGDLCQEGQCSGALIECVDPDPCLDAICNPTVGCVSQPTDEIPCDDGIECTLDDTCIAGMCVGDVSSCRCTPEFYDASKLNHVSIGANQAEDAALDVDGDGERDNTLGALGALANAPLETSLTRGRLIMLMEFRGLGPEPFAMAVYNGDLAPDHADCDVQAQTCRYLITPDQLDEETCDPIVSLPARAEMREDGTAEIDAGGPGTVMPFTIPLNAETTLDLTVHMVQFRGTATLTDGQVTALRGVLGGAIPETELNAALDGLPPDVFGDLGLDPQSVRDLLNVLAPNDIDTNEDGVPDAKSIALVLAGIDGRIAGLAEAEQ